MQIITFLFLVICFGDGRVVGPAVDSGFAKKLSIGLFFEPNTTLLTLKVIETKNASFQRTLITLLSCWGEQVVRLAITLNALREWWTEETSFQFTFLTMEHIVDEESIWFVADFAFVEIITLQTVIEVTLPTKICGGVQKVLIILIALRTFGERVTIQTANQRTFCAIVFVGFFEIVFLIVTLETLDEWLAYFASFQLTFLTVEHIVDEKGVGLVAWLTFVEIITTKTLRDGTLPTNLRGGI